MQTHIIQAGLLQIHADTPPPGQTLSMTYQPEAEGLGILNLELSAETPFRPVPLRLQWHLPCVDLLAQWRGDSSGVVGRFPPDWGREAVESRACSQAPVICLFSAAGTNRLTFAVSDAVHLTRLLAGVREEDGTMHCRVECFAGARPPATRFRLALRLDSRPQRWDKALAAVADWWTAVYPPARIPDQARRPLYASWYSFHQAMTANDLLAECERARALGCTGLVLDDGWQTADTSRGYGWTGDWRPERFPDMAGLCRAIHALGMTVILWYAAPFIGFHARNHARFNGKYLFRDERKQCSLVDPRYPEVRDFLADQYLAALRDWDVDGLKLDFIDAWHLPPGSPTDALPGMDTADLDEAVLQLLHTVRQRLLAVKPDLMLEFRQSYTGPAMRGVGTMFRAGDCPADAIGNRQRTLDLRALAGATPVHADPQMWHAGEPVESAALQVLYTLFAVPQISVRLDRLPADHLAMLRFWLAWWTERRALLLTGALELDHPEVRYTQARARHGDHAIVVNYQDVPLRLGPAEPRCLELINARRDEGLLLETTTEWRGRCRILDCQGRALSDTPVQYPAGVHRLPVPPAGLAELHAIS